MNRAWISHQDSRMLSFIRALLAFSVSKYPFDSD